MKIWQIMLGGALAILLTGTIAPADALHAVNMDVMLFLFGMFVVGEALVRSGYLDVIAYRFFGGFQNGGGIVLGILFGMGILSALLMNDTLAIIGTPLVLALAARNRLSAKLLLLSLAFAITTGSAMSPIGNPQNLLVAVGSEMASPFMTFGLYLLIPTLISLGLAYLVLRYFYGSEFSRDCGPSPEVPGVEDSRLGVLAQCSLAIILVLSGANILATLAGAPILITLPLIAVAAALPILLFSRDRFSLLGSLDWCTLIFFAAMFVLMEAVWQAGFFQSFINPASVLTVPVILGISVIISQFISNVPFVALFLPMILLAGGTTAQLMALAAGSTLAGNLTILGAASNVIIIQNAEKQGETLTFWEFARVGVPLMVVQVAVYWVWLSIVF